MSKKLFVTTAALLVVCLTYLVNAEDKKETKAACPVSGKAVSEESTVDYKGGKVAFCCPNCPAAFKKDTAKFAAKANHQLVATKQAKQVNCPLTGKKVNPDTAIEVSNVKVAFCCNGCKGKAEKADQPVALIFNDANFEKGFEVKKADKPEKSE